MDNKKTIAAINLFEFDFCHSLLNEGATYASIILVKDKTIISSYSTSQVWEGLYLGSGYSKCCHLFSATQELLVKSESFTLFWDATTPNNEISLYLNNKRKEKNICHGVSFCQKNRYGFLEILSIAGRACDFNFSSQVISNKEKIQQHLFRLQEKHFNKKAPVKVYFNP